MRTYFGCVGFYERMSGIFLEGMVKEGGICEEGVVHSESAGMVFGYGTARIDYWILISMEDRKMH